MDRSDIVKQSFGGALDRALAARKTPPFNLSQLAEAANVSLAYVSRLRAGQRELRESTVAQFARILGVSPTDLYGDIALTVLVRGEALTVGARCRIGEMVLIDATGGAVLIEDGARVYDFVKIYTSLQMNATETLTGPVKLGRDSVVGPGVVLTPGVVIPAGAAVPAGRIVWKEDQVDSPAQQAQSKSQAQDRPPRAARARR